MPISIYVNIFGDKIQKITDFENIMNESKCTSSTFIKFILGQKLMIIQY